MLIRLLPDGRLEWLDAVAGTVRRAGFEDWREAHSTVESVSLLVPGEDVLITEVEIVARQRHKLMQALPYAVEDQLVEEVDRYHYALGPALGDNRYIAAAVLRHRIDGWLNPFLQANVRVSRVVADSEVVPVTSDAAVLVFDDGRVLLRTGAAEAYAVATGEVDAFLTVAGKPRVIAYGRAPDSRALPEDWERREPGQPALALLAGWQAQRSGLLNLLQGDYAVGDPRQHRGRRVWRWAAGLLVLAVLMETTVRAVDYYQQTRRLEALQSEAEALLRDTFPGVQRIVDARLQMTQELEARRGGAGGSGAGILYLLQLAGPALTSDPNVRLESLTFRNGELLVEVRGDDLAQIEAIRQQLGERRLRARIESATTLENRATARIRIEGEA